MPETKERRGLSHFYSHHIKRHPAYRVWKEKFGAVKHALPSALRLATQRYRQLPSVVMVGAQKAGTTQLHAYAVTHPSLFAGANKEISYFSKHSERSVEWYRSRFPLSRNVEGGHVLDSSPSYMAHPDGLRLMRKVLPEAKVVVLLRDPVSRAFSHYQHWKTRHMEKRSFQEVVDDELEKNAYPAGWGVALEEGVEPMYGYVARGYYALQLELIYELYPRERVLVVDSAELFADTSAVCQRLFDFIGVEPFEVRTTKVYNRGYYKEKVDPLVADQLREHYRPYDEMLQQLTGRSFRWMGGASAASGREARRVA